jgi:Zn-dependent protease
VSGGVSTLAQVTLGGAKFALYLLVALAPNLLVHEYAHALMAHRLNDRTARFYGRLAFPPKGFVDPFGTLILPGFLLVLRAAGLPVPLFAYAKPMPRNPNVLARPTRDTNLIALAGPLANLAIAILIGLLLRVVGLGAGELTLLLLAAVQVSVTFFVFYLMPIPGLDGALMLGSVLPPRPREVYRNLDQYLPLWILLIFFVLGSPVLAFVQALSNAVCQPVSGFPCF